MASSAVTPKRIQRKRTKDWKMPPNTVYVGRPTKWGNPYTGHDGPPLFIVNLYRKMVRGNVWSEPNWMTIREELSGRNLACWCPLDQPCHADVLLEIANSREVPDVQP